MINEPRGRSACADRCRVEDQEIDLLAGTVVFGVGSCADPDLSLSRSGDLYLVGLGIDRRNVRIARFIDEIRLRGAYPERLAEGELGDLLAGLYFLDLLCLEAPRLRSYAFFLFVVRSYYERIRSVGLKVFDRDLRKFRLKLGPAFVGNDRFVLFRAFLFSFFLLILFDQIALLDPHLVHIGAVSVIPADDYVVRTPSR